MSPTTEKSTASPPPPAPTTNQLPQTLPPPPPPSTMTHTTPSPNIPAPRPPRKTWTWCSPPRSINAVKPLLDRSSPSSYALNPTINSSPRPPCPQTNKAAILTFIRTNTSIPVPRIIHEGTDIHGNHYTIMEEIHGHTLDTAWQWMDTEARNKVCLQMNGFLKELRRVGVRFMSAVRESGHFEHFLLGDGVSADAEIVAKVVRRVKKSVARSAAKTDIQNPMPRCTPFAFTNEDRCMENIIVRDGVIVGFVDWEGAGIFPAWWEFTRVRRATGVIVGLEMLGEGLEEYRDGLAFYLQYHYMMSVDPPDDPALQGKIEYQLGELLKGKI